ncbi:MAG: hypothetical protein K2Y39_19755 [Candidatus Obscuribacterales bacterium]|nr:hypothetical protein [Candidatus Obscuribacterales bacterium]
MPDPAIPEKAKEIKPPREKADDSSDFLDAAEEEVTKTRTETTGKNASNSTLEVQAGTTLATLDLSQSIFSEPESANPAHETVKKRVAERLGNTQNNELLIGDTTEILLSRKSDGQSAGEIDSAKLEAAKLAEVRKDLGIPKLPSRAALEIVNIKENLKLPDFKAASAVLAVKGLGGFETAQAASQYMAKAGIKPSEIEKYKELVAAKRINHTDLGKLIKLDEYTREDVINILAKERQLLSPERVSAMLKCDADTISDLVKREGTCEMFNALKPENINSENIKRILDLRADTPKLIKAFEGLSAAEQVKALAMKGKDFDVRASILVHLQHSLGDKTDPKAATQILNLTEPDTIKLRDALEKRALPVDIANEMLSHDLETSRIGSLSSFIANGVVDPKTARDLLKLEAPVRNGLISLFSSAHADVHQTEAFVKLATDKTLSVQDVEAYRNASLRLRLDAKDILAIEKHEKSEREALVGILKDQSSNELPRDKAISADAFKALASQDYPNGGLEAIRKAISADVMTANLLDRFVKKTEGYRASMAALMRESELSAQSVKLMAGDGIYMDLMAKLLVEKKANRISSENINEMMAAEPRLRDVMRNRMLDPNYDKNPLSSECLTHIFKTEPTETTLKGYFDALDRGSIKTQQEMIEIMNLPKGSRKAIEEGFIKGIVDRHAIQDLQATHFAEDEIRRYTRVLQDAKARGIEIAKLNETSDYMSLQHEYKEVNVPENVKPVDRMEAAFLLISQGLDPDAPDNVNRVQKELANTRELRERLSLSVSESLTVDRFQKENPAVEITSKIIERTRELVSSHLLQTNFQDALGAACIMQNATGDLDARSCLSAKDKVLALSRRFPGSNLEDLYRNTARHAKFLELAAGPTDIPFHDIKLKTPNNIEDVALELSEYAKKRAAEIDKEIKSLPFRDTSIEKLRSQRDGWLRLEESILAENGRNALVEMLTAEPELAWQVLQNTPTEKLKTLSNERFIELANSAKQHLPTLAVARQEELTRELVSQFETRFKKGIEANRQEFISSWLSAAGGLPSINSERRPATFEILKNLQAGDLERLSNEQLKQLTSSITVEQMEKLSKEKQAKLLIDIVRESGNPGRAGTRDALHRDVLRHITPEIIRKASIDEVRWLTGELRKMLKSEPGLTDTKPTAEIIGDITNKIVGEELNKETIDKLLADRSIADRALALELLAERAPHLTEAGFVNQLNDFAQKLRNENLVVVKATGESRGRQVETVKLYCFSDSTQTKALAYQLKKHTHLQVELEVLKPGQPLPTGKGVLIEPLSSVPENMRESVKAASNLRIAHELEAFQKGLNYKHLAVAEATGTNSQAKKQLDQMLEEAKRTGRVAEPKGDTKSIPTGATTENEFKLLKNLAQQKNNENRARVEAGSLLFFAQKQGNLGGPVQLHAMVALASLDVGRYDDLIKQAHGLQDSLAKKIGATQENTFFIVDEKVNSNHLSIDLYRLANNMEGKEFDSRFITFEQAKAMKGAGLCFVQLNDGIYSGTEALKNIPRMQELKANGAKVAIANLFGYAEGVKVATDAGNLAGVEIIAQAEYQDAYAKAAGSPERSKISRILARHPEITEGLPESSGEFTVKQAERILGAPDWNAESYKPGEKSTGAKVVSSLFMSHIRSNTTARLLSDLANYLGVPKAHIESKGQLELENAQTDFKDINDPRAQREAVSKLLKSVHSRAAEEYSESMENAFKPSEVNKPEEMRAMLKEGLQNFLEQHQKTNANLGLEGIRLDVEFGNPPGARMTEEKTLSVVLAPSLAEPSHFQKAKVEIMRQLLTHRAQQLASQYPQVDAAGFNKSIDQVIKEKLFSVEHPLKEITSVPGIDRFTEVSAELLVGSKPSDSKKLPLIDSLESLKEMGVTSIIDLGLKPNEAQKQWCELNRVEYKHIPINDPNLITHEQINGILAEIERVKGQRGRVFVQDFNGTDRGPAIVAAYRINNGASAATATEELSNRFLFNSQKKPKLAKTLEEREKYTVASSGEVRVGLAPHQLAASKAIDFTIAEAQNHLAQKTAAEGGAVKFSEPITLNFKDKPLTISGIDIVEGKLYLKATQDGKRYSTEGWLKALRDGLEERAKSTTIPATEAQAAKIALESIASSIDARVSIIKALASNFANESKAIIPAGAETATVAADANVTPLRKGGGAGGSTLPSGAGPIVAAGGSTEIRSTQAGGYEVTDSKPTEGEIRAGTEMPKEDIARLKSKILEDKENKYTPEQKQRALQVLEMAERGHKEAREALRGAVGRGGGIDKAAGSFVGMGMVVTTLAGWYAYEQLNSARSPYIGRAEVR